MHRWLSSVKSYSALLLQPHIATDSHLMAVNGSQSQNYFQTLSPALIWKQFRFMAGFVDYFIWKKLLVMCTRMPNSTYWPFRKKETVKNNHFYNFITDI